MEHNIIIMELLSCQWEVVRDLSEHVRTMSTVSCKVLSCLCERVVAIHA